MGTWGESLHVGSTLPDLRPKTGLVHPLTEGIKEKKIRETDSNSN